MNPLERLKQKIVSRLTDEVVIIYFENEIDNKVAKLIYKDREIIIQEEAHGFAMFLYKGDYDWKRYYGSFDSKEETIENAKYIIKNDIMWEEV